MQICGKFWLFVYLLGKVSYWHLNTLYCSVNVIHDFMVGCSLLFTFSIVYVFPQLLSPINLQPNLEKYHRIPFDAHTWAQWHCAVGFCLFNSDCAWWHIFSWFSSSANVSVFDRLQSFLKSWCSVYSQWKGSCCILSTFWPDPPVTRLQACTSASHMLRYTRTHVVGFETIIRLIGSSFLGNRTYIVR